MTKLRSLNIPSLTAEVLRILESEKIKTVEVLLFTKFQSSLDPQVLARVIKDVESYFSPTTLSFNELLEITSSQSFSVSLPCRSIAALVGGRLCSGQVIELCGTSACGKSQFCHFLSMLVAQSSGVYYVDSGLAFSASRIRDMSQSSDVPRTDNSVEDMLGRIRYFAVFDGFVLLNLLEQIDAMLKYKECYFGQNLRLIVIDSIATLLTPLLGGIKKTSQTKYPQRQGHSVLVEISRLLKEIAVTYDILVVTTNTATGEEGDRRPALGMQWSSVPNIRLLLGKESSIDEEELFCASVESSNNSELASKAYFKIRTSGIIDLEKDTMY